MSSIQAKRGLATNKPTSAKSGEFIYTTDGKNLYIGNGDGQALTLLNGLVKVGDSGTPDYLNSSFFEQDSTNHIRLKQTTLLSGVNADKVDGKDASDFVQKTGDNNIGNLGIGVTLETWKTDWNVLQIGGLGAIAAYNSAAANSWSRWINNAYYDNTNSRWQCILGGEPATMIIQSAGGISFDTAPSVTNNDDPLTFTDRVYIGNSGNAGFNTVDIESWHSAYKAIEFPVAAIVYGAANSDLMLYSNAYFDGAEKYKTTGAASMYIQTTGTHTFKVVVSGSANASFSWTDALKIKNDANLLFQNSILFKNSSGELQLRNTGDTDYSDLRIKNLYVSGTTTFGILNADQVDGKDVNDSGTGNTVLWTAEKIQAAIDAVKYRTF